MRYLVFIIAVIANVSWAYDEGCFPVTQISLSIDTSFGGSVYYAYRPKADGYECLLKSSTDKNGNEKIIVRRYKGGESGIPQMFSKSLDFNLRDEVQFLDGTTWTIKSSVYQEFQISISTPEHDTEKRGYKGLLEFRSYLERQIERANKS